MAKILTQIILNEKDIKDLVAERYGLDGTTTTISISHSEGDAREPSYTSITVTGKKNVKEILVFLVFY
jgi:alpha-L-fucosidase